MYAGEEKHRLFTAFLDAIKKIYPLQIMDKNQQWVHRKHFKMGIIFMVLFTVIVLAESKPHIIVIVADDLGWNDVSFHGSPQIPTPNLDLLARNGIILNNYYVCPICTPSRGSLMTGLYPIHTGLQHYVIFAPEPWGLPLKFQVLPEHLKSLGYKTHAIGKWHLGFFHKEYTPTYRGFDSHYGYWGGEEDYFDHTLQSNEYWGLDFHENLTSVRDELRQYSTHLYADRAVKIVNSHNSSKPIFLYLAFQAVHSANSYSPLQAPPEYVARFAKIKDPNRRIFAGMVSAMDDGVGALLKVLQSKSMLKNSIIVFTTDNGGPAAGFNSNAASNWPLRGVKDTLWEGGVRGAGFIWSPLLQKNGFVSSNLMHITDWLPTLFSAAGGNVSSLGSLDGYDMWKSLSTNSSSPRTEVLLNIDPMYNNSALRVGDFKIIQGLQYDGNWDGWYGPSGRENGSYLPRSSDDVDCGVMPKNASTNCKPSIKPCLFNVKQDPCEYYNLAEAKPQILSQLLKRLSEYNSTAIPPGNKPADPRSAPKYHNYEWINWADFL